MMGQIVDVHFLKETVAGEETDMQLVFLFLLLVPSPLQMEENPHKLFESSMDPQGHRPHDFLTSPLDLEICAASPSSDFLISLHLTLLSIQTSQNLRTRSTDLLLQVTTSLGDLILY